MKKIITKLFLLMMIAWMLNVTNAADSNEYMAAKMLSSKNVIAIQDSESGYNLGANITRKEIMKVVMNLSGKTVVDSCNQTFSDVSNDWGCKYIETALKNQFIAANETFRPDDSITKAESMKLVLKARNIAKTHDTWDWREDYMLTAFDAGVITEKYSDHNTKATRWWIFTAAIWDRIDESVAVNEINDEVLLDDDSEAEDLLSMLLAGIDDIDPKIGYKDYDPTLIGINDTTVLFFNASWCPSCVAAKNSLSSEDFVGENILILSVDYDDSTELKNTYWVTAQHTFVQIDTAGTLIKKWVGSKDLAEIQAQIQK